MGELPHWKYEAHVGFMPTYGAYLSSYKNAVNVLFDKISNGEPVDTLSLPFLFMVRHSLEVGYKMNINYLSKYSGLDDKVNWGKHYLKELHDAFGKHYEAASAEFNVSEEDDAEFSEMYEEVGGLTSTLNKIDRGSYSFRYPVDLKQSKVFNHDDRINLHDVKEVYDQAMVLLFHTADVLSQYTDYHDYMQSIMQSELRSAYEP